MSRYEIMMTFRCDIDTFKKLMDLTNDHGSIDNRSELIRKLIHKEHDHRFNSIVGKIKNLFRREYGKNNE